MKAPRSGFSLCRLAARAASACLVAGGVALLPAAEALTQPAGAGGDPATGEKLQTVEKSPLPQPALSQPTFPPQRVSYYEARERAWREAGFDPPFAGIAQTRTGLEQLAIDLQLFDLCRDRRVTDAELAPLLEAAAKQFGGEANCTEVMRRLGYRRQEASTPPSQ